MGGGGGRDQPDELSRNFAPTLGIHATLLQLVFLEESQLGLSGRTASALIAFATTDFLALEALLLVSYLPSSPDLLLPPPPSPALCPSLCVCLCLSALIFSRCLSIYVSISVTYCHCCIVCLGPFVIPPPLVSLGFTCCHSHCSVLFCFCPTLSVGLSLVAILVSSF